MNSKRRFWLALAVLVAGGQVHAQYSEYDWARGLARSFGFDDMAEKIFTDLSAGSSRTPLQKQQGALGLAELRQLQARRSNALADKLRLMDEARKLMQGAVANWPDRNTPAYFDAVFTMTDLLEERGEVAMTAIKAGTVDPKQVAEVSQGAEGDYTRAEAELEKIRQSLGEPDAETEPDKWRTRNRAWYSLIQLKLNKALTYKKESAKRGALLSEASRDVEDYVLENESGSEEALIGALYGYILRGRIYGEMGTPGDLMEAKASFTSVLDQVLWENPENPDDTSYRLAPVVQSLVERTYYQLLEFLNGIKETESVLKYGKEMEARFRKMSLPYRTLGRAARVEYAKALMNSGDMGSALGIASEVVDSGAGDASGVLATRLVAEIITATPDKSGFAPETIRSAAKGAYSQRGDKLNDAIAYFEILLQLLDRVPESERAYIQADTWLHIGKAYYFLDRRLEAAAAFREGLRRGGKEVTQDDVASSLVDFWSSTLRGLVSATKSDAILALKRECDEWIIANPGVGGTVSPGELLYRKAVRGEESAEALLREKKPREAIAAYEAASAVYGEAIGSGGPKKERSMIRIARVDLKIGRVMASERMDGARARLEQAKKAFQEYLKFSADPANRLTNPEELTQRDIARAEAAFSVTTANSELIKLLGKGGDAAAIKKLREESVRSLEGYETSYSDQTNFVAAALAERIDLRLDLGDVAGAKADYEELRKRSPDSSRASSAALRIAQALLDQAEPAFKAVVGDATPLDESAWEAAKAKSGFAPAAAKYREVMDFYREFLLAGDGDSRIQNWERVLYLWTLLGDWEATYDLHRKGLAKFGSLSTSDAKILDTWRNKLLHATTRLAKAAQAQGKDDEATRLWAEAGTLVDALSKTAWANQPTTIRLMAETLGGYITTTAGRVRYVPNLGRFAETLPLWTRVEKKLESESLGGTPAWWEARFYLYYAAYQTEKAKGGDVVGVRRKLESLRAAQPEFGGKEWKPYFEWLLNNLAR